MANKLRTDRGGRRDSEPWWGLGQSPKTLTLGGAPKEMGRGRASTGPPELVRGTLSAAKDAGRAIPLSWEICDFPTHGEPQAVCAGVGPWAFPEHAVCCWEAAYCQALNLTVSSRLLRSAAVWGNA